VASKRKRRRARGAIFLRWLAVAAVGLMALLYYRPLRSYVDTRSTLSERAAEVRSLRAKKEALERRLEQSKSPAALTREARRLGLVKPGERLFIVKGIEAWRRARSTIGRDG
jgi:cell division protein FtsB